MKTRHVLISAILAIFSSIAVAGLVEPVPVSVDEVNMIASGDMWTARTADNNVEFIGCGIREFDVGVTFGFCQAADADDVYALCFTDNPVLLDAVKSISDFSFVRFNWDVDGECTAIGISTQSFYLPNFKIQKGMGGDDDDDD